MRKINVIAMAGLGQRFRAQNYKTPKPLIIIKKKPMFYYATKSLPTCFFCGHNAMKYVCTVVIALRADGTN